jgi:alkylation response protein AidB-like acyl-CoA dehydrogenase
VARAYAGSDSGRIADDGLRARILGHNMNNHAFRLTQRRTVEESQDGTTPGPATSIFKMYGTELQQDKARLMCDLRGTDGFVWTGDHVDTGAREWTRAWLSTRAASIYSGSNEIQRNIIAKRVLGLPD